MSAPGLPPGAWPWLNDFARWLGSWLWRPVYRLHVHHQERMPREGPVVVVANHSAYVDGPLLYPQFGRRPVFLVKQEMFGGFLGQLLVWLGQLGITRGAPDRKALLTAVDVLKSGGLIGVFPEGTRGSGEVAAAQGGAAWLARTTGASVLPVVTRGTRRPADGRRRIRPRVDILFGRPFTVAPGGGKAGLAAATETVRTELAALVRELDEVRSRT